MHGEDNSVIFQDLAAACVQNDDIPLIVSEFERADLIVSVVALRTGPGMKECERIIQSIEHFYGHLEIACCGSLGLCSVEYKEDAAPRMDEIIAFCETM